MLNHRHWHLKRSKWNTYFETEYIITGQVCPNIASIRSDRCIVCLYCFRCVYYFWGCYRLLRQCCWSENGDWYKSEVGCDQKRANKSHWDWKTNARDTICPSTLSDQDREKAHRLCGQWLGCRPISGFRRFHLVVSSVCRFWSPRKRGGGERGLSMSHWIEYNNKRRNCKACVYEERLV